MIECGCLAYCVKNLALQEECAPQVKIALRFVIIAGDYDVTVTESPFTIVTATTTVATRTIADEVE